MKTQETKTRKMLVKLIDSKGNIYSKIFSIDIPGQFDSKDFQAERIEIAKEFVKPYPNALFQLASGLVASQVSELDKIRILADSTLDANVKVRFVSDYNAATAKRVHSFNNLLPKAKAYKAEKGLRDITIDGFLLDFSPLDNEGKKYNPFKYLTLTEDQKGFTLNAVDLKDNTDEAADK